MACGKSTYGRALSKRLGWKFADLDDKVLPGSSAGAALRQLGVEAFRVRESAALAEALSASENLVLALGGGTILDEANRRLLKSEAVVIWLRTSMDIILNELSNSDRPLAEGLSTAELESMLRQREPLYSEVADAVLTIDENDMSKVVDDLERIIREIEK